MTADLTFPTLALESGAPEGSPIEDEWSDSRNTPRNAYTATLTLDGRTITTPFYIGLLADEPTVEEEVS